MTTDVRLRRISHERDATASISESGASNESESGKTDFSIENKLSKL